MGIAIYFELDDKEGPKKLDALLAEIREEAMIKEPDDKSEPELEDFQHLAMRQLMEKGPDKEKLDDLEHKMKDSESNTKPVLQEYGSEEKEG